MTTQLTELTIEEVEALIKGLPTYCANMTFMLASKNYTVPEAVELATTVLDADTAVTTARSTYRAAIVARDKVAENEGVLVKELREILGLNFINSTTTLDALAITPRKSPKPLSAQARLAATEKARATREARGTTSKKQKAKITGNVTGVTVTPVTTGTASATAVASTAEQTSASSSSPASPATGLGASASGTGSTPHA